MAKRHFFVRLIPPRATFPYDMSPEEESLMASHAEYLRGQFEDGRLVVYGPVLSENPFGLIVAEADEEREVHELMAGDPTVAAGLNTYDIAPMHVTGARPS